MGKVDPQAPVICNYTVVPGSAGIATAVMENQSNAGDQSSSGR